MSHGGLKRARSWKRRIQPKEACSSPGLLYSEGPAGSRGWSQPAETPRTQCNKAVGLAPTFWLIAELTLLVGIGARRGLPAGALQLRQQTRRFARHDDERCLPFLIGLDCLPTIETSICPGEDLYDARRESAKNTLHMARNLLARWPIAVVQLAPDVFSGFRQKGKDRLITLLAFVLRVVAFPAAHLSAIERVHGRIGVQRDGAQPHVGRLPHPFSHPLLHLQQLPRHSQM